MKTSSTREMADQLVSVLPADGYPVGKSTAAKALERYTGKLTVAQIDAVVALAAATGRIVRQFGGTAIARVR